jgi:general secretion pathway protein K
MKEYGKPAPGQSPPLRPDGNEQGIALLMVLFAIVLLVALVIEFDYQTRVELNSSLRFIHADMAMALARSGLLAGEEILRGNLSDAYDGPDQFWARPFPPYPLGEGSVSVKIEDESGKININLLSQAKSVRLPAIAQIKRLFTLLEIDSGLVDEIISWIDCENDIYYQGLKPSYTCQKNHFLETLSELRLVRGITDDVYSKIEPYLTVYPQKNPSAKINVNTADKMVLQTLFYKNSEGGWQFDITRSLAEEIIKARPVKSVNDLVMIGGLKSIGDSLKLWSADVKSFYFTISSNAQIKDTQKRFIETIKRPARDLNSKIIRYYTRLE